MLIAPYRSAQISPSGRHRCYFGNKTSVFTAFCVGQGQAVSQVKELRPIGATAPDATIVGWPSPLPGWELKGKLQQAKIEKKKKT